MAPPTDRMHQYATLLSPIAIIGLGMGAQHAVGSYLGTWSWVPTILVFWSAIACVIKWSRRDRPTRVWFTRPRGSVAWSILAVGIGLVSVREVMAGWRSLLSLEVFVPWLLVGLLNPWFEESYWRGALIDATGRWKPLGVVYSTFVFAISHPLIWGVHSVALGRPAAMVGLAVAGAIWGVVYWRTGSLRWAVVGHGCGDLLGLSVPVLLNIYVPSWAP